MTRDERAERIVRALHAAFVRRDAVFADTADLLENQVPEGVSFASREHVNFLFYLISQDHGVKSARLYAKAKALYAQAPALFDPASVLERCSQDDLTIALRPLGLRYPQNATKAWLHNSSMLLQLYRGDARRIVAGTDAQEMMRRIRAFKGYGPKTGGLLFRVLVGIRVAHPENPEAVGFPTDIHDTRIAALTGIADIPETINEETAAPYVPLAAAAWRTACARQGLDWLVVDRALWILGSRGCASGRHHDCPIRGFCTRGGA